MITKTRILENSMIRQAIKNARRNPASAAKYAALCKRIAEFEESPCNRWTRLFNGFVQLHIKYCVEEYR